MKTHIWIACLLLIGLTASLMALSPQATTAVQADDSPRETRQGAWLDTVVMTEEDSPAAAVSQLQANELDLYAYGITDPSLWQKMLEAPDLELTEAHGSFNELTFNPSGPTFTDGRLNPFYVAAIREEMNRLIDRNYIAQVICGGMTTPRWLPIQTIGADYARYQPTAQALEAEYAYDPVTAEAAIAAEMMALGATLVDDTWTYGGEPVVITALIRVEDERLEIGDYVADQLEAIGFATDRQYKTSAEASPCWLTSDPADGCFHYYTGGWVSTRVERDQSNVFGDYYTPLGWGLPLWQAYTPSTDFLTVAEQLYYNDFATLDERDDLFEQALDLAMEDSVRIYLKDDFAATPRRAGTAIASDLAGGVYGAQMWPYVARFDSDEGGTMRVALPSFLEQPWNPVAGSSWVYDRMPINATMDHAFIRDPNDGLVLPQRALSADLVALTDQPMGKTHDWVSLSFEPEITVPGDAWVDWDASAQEFITAADLNPAMTATVKSTVYYPVDLFSTVTWHDGSPLDAADFIMGMILTFDRGKPDSAIYDESYEPTLNGFLSTFRGVRIISESPLTIETYYDRYQIDAELIVEAWWPNYAYGPGAWHNLAAAIRAEEAGDLAFSSNKADALGIEQTDFVAGPSLDSLEYWMNVSATGGYIPYEPTLGAYVDPAEATTRWGNLQTWYAAQHHFWLGTGPFFLGSADPAAGTLTLLHNPAFPDEAGRWDAFAVPPIPEVMISYDSGAPGSYFNVTGSGFPPDSTAFIVINDHLLSEVPVDGSGEIAFTLTTDEADEGTYHLRVTVNPSGGLAFVLDESEPVHTKVGDLQEVEVPEGIAVYYVYLPVVLRSYP